jgi:threonine aldolase
MSASKKTAAAELTPSELKRSCTWCLPGHVTHPPGAELARIAAWCTQQGYSEDYYGEGALINAFERKIAELLGLPAAVFMPSGTMAQQIALRIWCERARNPRFGMHPTCHLEKHEQHGYSHVHGLVATLLGAPDGVIVAQDLDRCTDMLSALVTELPMRELGGVLPSWEELQALKSVARAKGVRLHMDGARLWEARAFYRDRSYADLCRDYDSVYVSFYKGIGGLTGAMLLGDAGFIAQARIWLRRTGGNLYQMHPYVASAAMHFDQQIERMPAYFRRAQAFADALAAGLPALRVHPRPPQANLLHIHAPLAAGALTAARDRIAREEGRWVASRFVDADQPGWAWCEIYVGEHLLALSDDEAVSAFARLLARAREAPAPA